MSRLSPSEGERTEVRGLHFSDATLTLPSPLQGEAILNYALANLLEFH